jgi:HEAT repeat protein
MKSRSGKRIAFWSMMVCLGILGVFVLIYKDEALARWYLHKLREGTDEEKLAAVERLGDLGSRIAVPELVELTLQKSELGDAAEKALEKTGAEAVNPLLGVLLDEKRRPEARYNAAVLLVRFGPRSPTIVQTLISVYDAESAQNVSFVLRNILEKRRDVSPDPNLLIRALKRKELALRCDLLISLEQIFPDAELVLAVLRQALRDNSRDVRLHAAHALLQLGPRAAGAVPSLVQALGDPAPRVRDTAAMALGQLGPEAEAAVPVLEKALEDPDEAVSQAAAMALRNISPGALITAAASPAERIRLLAIETLSAAEGIGDQEAAAGAILKRARRDDSEEVRLAAVSALARMAGGQGGEGTLETIVEALVERAREDASGDVRFAALQALAGMKGRAEAAIPALLELAGRLDGDLRYAAVEALGKIGRKPEIVVPALIDTFQEEDTEICRAAAYALARFGSRAESAIPVLAAALERVELSEPAAYALSRFGRAALPELTRRLTHEKSHARLSAALAIGKLGREAVEAVPALSNLLGDEDEHVRQTAAHILGTIGSGAKQALPALEKSLRDDALVVRVTAAISMTRIDAQAAVATVPALADALAERALDLDGRLEILAALKTLGPSAVPALARALEDDIAWVRLRAATQLGEIGPAAREGAPALRHALADEDESVREAATEALKMIVAVEEETTGEAENEPGSGEDAP